MNNEKKIELTFDLEQVTNDVLVKCNQISQSIRDDAMEDIKANILEPDNPESRSIINRALTEAFGEVKTLCQRYLKVGRTVDNNKLERMVRNITYVKEQAKDSQGHLLFKCKAEGVDEVVYHNDVYDQWWEVDTELQVIPDEDPEPYMVDSDEIATIEYEKIPLDLFIPNFNVAVTDHLKSGIHKYVVDYIMSRFLQDQLADKAAEYKGLADGEDRSMIIRDLNARDRFNCRKPSWT
jgi:hypothetical protein